MLNVPNLCLASSQNGIKDGVRRLLADPELAVSHDLNEIGDDVLLEDVLQKGHHAHRERHQERERERERET
jgi:hypothetical protein